MKRHLVLLLFILVIPGTLLWDGFYRFLRPPTISDPIVRVVRILPGMSLKSIARLLEQEGLIQDACKFLVLAWWKKAGKKVQWGDFELRTGMPPGTLLDYLVTGRTMLKRVTIPEGFTLQQVAGRLTEENLVQEKAFLDSARDPDLLKALGIPGDSLEGYLFPDTYFFHRGMSSQTIQKRMVGRFQQVWGELEREGVSAEAPSQKNMVILASVVEKESGLGSERPLIASVFFNRLEQGMALQSDPTVIYGLKNFNGDLTKKDLQKPGPYNTYIKPGLPPGPIANPGREALRAVLSPARSDYLYFVSKNDGSHCFSRTLKEHQRAVARYQLSLKSNFSSKIGRNKI